MKFLRDFAGYMLLGLVLALCAMWLLARLVERV